MKQYLLLFNDPLIHGPFTHQSVFDQYSMNAQATLVRTPFCAIFAGRENGRDYMQLCARTHSIGGYFFMRTELDVNKIG